MRRLLPPLAALVVLTVAAPCAATTPEDAALAEQLFRDGKERMAEGQYGDACPKLAESHRLDPAGGTLLTLALCHEAEGRTASAWAEFADALALAKRDQRPDREAISREHVEALGPRLRRLRIRLSAEVASVADLSIRRDGVEVGRAGWDASAPVDPGAHVIEASAEGYEPFTVKVSVGEAGATTFVDVPRLVPRTRFVEAPPAGPPPAAKQGISGLRVASYITGGVAVIGLGSGIAFALIAKGKRDDANAVCPTSACKDADAVEASSSAARSADIATTAFVLSAVALASSITLLIFANAEPRPSAPASRLPALLRF